MGFACGTLYLRVGYMMPAVCIMLYPALWFCIQLFGSEDAEDML
jgi:hypothetical protein